jgi:hypothetical protein
MRLRERVYAAIPGWEANTGARLRSEAQRIRFAGDDDSEADVRDEILRLANAGEEIPMELGARLVAAHQSFEARNRLSGMIDEVAAEHGSDRNELVRANERAAVDVLRQELERILEETRGLAPMLKGLHSAEEVIGEPAAVQQAWTRLGELTHEYGELRAIQHQIAKTVAEDSAAAIGRLVRSWGMFANSLDVVPAWRAGRVNSWRTSSDHRSGVKPLLDWLAEPLTESGWSEAQDAGLASGLWPDDDHRGHLIWLATKGKPWIPTVKVMVALQTLAGTAISPIGSGSEEPMIQLQALAQICEITGQPYPEGLPDPHAFVIRRGDIAPFDAKAAARRTLETTFV